MAQVGRPGARFNRSGPVLAGAVVDRKGLAVPATSGPVPLGKFLCLAGHSQSGGIAPFSSGPIEGGLGIFLPLDTPAPWHEPGRFVVGRPAIPTEGRAAVLQLPPPSLRGSSLRYCTKPERAATLSYSAWACTFVSWVSQ